MTDQRRIKCYKLSAKCPRAHFTGVYFDFGSGHQEYQAFICASCGQLKWSQLVGDRFLDALLVKYKNCPGKGANEEWYRIIHVVYEKFSQTIDPCDCGGSFRVVDKICPICSDFMEVDYGKSHELSTVEINLVTHANINFDDFVNQESK